VKKKSTSLQGKKKEEDYQLYILMYSFVSLLPQTIQRALEAKLLSLKLRKLTKLVLNKFFFLITALARHGQR
jgi:hypothetical protein